MQLEKNNNWETMLAQLCHLTWADYANIVAGQDKQNTGSWHELSTTGDGTVVPLPYLTFLPCFLGIFYNGWTRPSFMIILGCVIGLTRDNVPNFQSFCIPYPSFAQVTLLPTKSIKH